MRQAQTNLCNGFEALEERGASAPHPAGRFVSATWERPGGGGGTARVLTEGAVFERAGVNVSVVAGAEVPPSLAKERPSTAAQPYFATGVSLVLHPRNPYVPTFHANFRYFAVGNDWWFGGGIDLTPYYGFVEDAVLFHQTLKTYCDRHPMVDYQELKQTCDNYFYIKHRQEMRGVGGIFFDHLRPTVDNATHWQQLIDFVRDGTETILACYRPIVERRMQTPYDKRERDWQLYRRGRYVEFNLVYDRGTLFGLQTQGNIEAILMSLPPLARWEFQYQPEPDSPEAAMQTFLQPHDWAAMYNTEPTDTT